MISRCLIELLYRLVRAEFQGEFKSHSADIFRRSINPVTGDCVPARKLTTPTYLQYGLISPGAAPIRLVRKTLVSGRWSEPLFESADTRGTSRSLEREAGKE